MYSILLSLNHSWRLWSLLQEGSQGKRKQARGGESKDEEGDGGGEEREGGAKGRSEEEERMSTAHGGCIALCWPELTIGQNGIGRA